MAYFNEFPHTRNYDADLGWLIRNVKKLQQKFDRCPTWYGEWVPEIEYPALAFVQYGNAGDIYMAIKPVPSNTPITDESYWIKTGSTSEQILDLQRRMSAAEGRISDAERRISATEKEIEEMKRNKILFVSDSYGNPAYTGGVNFCDMFNRMLGTDAEIVWQGSSGFGGTAGGLSNSFRNILNRYAGDRSAIDIIAVVGGANDLKVSATDIINGMAEFDALVKSDFKNAKVIIVACGITFANDNYSSFAYRQTKKYTYMRGCSLHGWIYAENSEFILSNNKLLSDGVHPATGNGLEALTHGVIDCIRSHKANIHHFIRSTGAEAKPPITQISGEYNMMQEIDGNVGRIWFSERNHFYAVAGSTSNSLKLTGNKTPAFDFMAFDGLLFPNGESSASQFGSGSFSANVLVDILTNESGTPTYRRMGTIEILIVGLIAVGIIHVVNEWPNNNAYVMKFEITDSNIFVPII